MNSRLRRLLHKDRTVSGCRWHMRGEVITSTATNWSFQTLTQFLWDSTGHAYLPLTCLVNVSVPLC